eukprot:269764_1
MAHVATVSEKKPNESVNTLNSSNQFEDDSDDAKFLETNILSQMTQHKMNSLEFHLADTIIRLINRKLDWQHIVSAIMHELDQKISFYVARSVRKLNISKMRMSDALEKKLNKKMSKEEVEYVRQLIQRAKQNTKPTPTTQTPFQTRDDEEA